METKRIYIKDTEHVRDEELWRRQKSSAGAVLWPFLRKLYTDWEEMLWMRMLQKDLCSQGPAF